MPTQLEKLLEQEKRLKARIAAAKARQKTRRRKDETRLKILVGAMVINDHFKKGTLSELLERLRAYLTRDNDRKVLYILEELMEDSQERKEG